MIGKNRAVEIAAASLASGKESAMVTYDLSEETYNRYIREAKKHLEGFDDLSAIVDRYSPDELSALAKGRRSIASGASISFDGKRIKVLAMTDTHIGSAYTEPAYIEAAIQEGIAQGCDIAVHAGDVTEGMSGRDGHVYELSHIGYKAQREAAIRALELWDVKPWYFISGNHDAWYLSKGNAGADIVADICESLGNAQYLGLHEGDIDINGVKVRLWHGEDVGSYATSYRLQKLIESFSGGEKPAVLLCGHTHKAGYFFERNVHAVTLGSIQKQSAWMRRKRLAAHCGFWILDMTIGDGEVKSFSPTFYPFYR